MDSTYTLLLHFKSWRLGTKMLKLCQTAKTLQRPMDNAPPLPPTPTLQSLDNKNLKWFLVFFFHTGLHVCLKELTLSTCFVLWIKDAEVIFNRK